jgi:hypothetical protein
LHDCTELACHTKETSQQDTTKTFRIIRTEIKKTRAKPIDIPFGHNFYKPVRLKNGTCNHKCDKGTQSCLLCPLCDFFVFVVKKYFVQFFYFFENAKNTKGREIKKFHALSLSFFRVFRDCLFTTVNVTVYFCKVEF